MLVRRVIWGMLLSLFFVSILVLSWPLSRELFVSPDENAAFVFAEQFATTGHLAIDESLNTEFGGLIHPRSTVGYGDTIVPASFVGFILLLGVVGSVFGKAAMFLVTPLLSIAALVLWRDSVRRVFKDELLADVAAFLLMIHPAFWYYSGRVMMHNVSFLALLVIGLWWCLAQPLSSWVSKQTRAGARLVDFCLAGALFGAALIIRTSEIIWLVPALATVFGVYRAQIGWRASTACALGFGVMLILLGAINSCIYGGPLVNGYTVDYPYAAVVISDSDGSAVIGEPGRNILLPFGFHEHNILHNVMNYGFKLYPWMSVLAVAGLVIAYVEMNDERKLWRRVAVFTLALAAWLGVVYGSWMIIDNPDPKIISLGNSHVRYWLPLFALSSLLGARALVYMLGNATWPRRVLVGGLLGLCLLLSLRLVFYGHDGFVPSRAALATFENKQARILASTESDAIVIVDRADKYLYPERRVVVPLRSEATYQALPAMLGAAPVYYFGITLPQTDLDYLNNQKLPELGARIELVQTINEESLYLFTSLP